MKEGVIFIEKAFWDKLTTARDRYVILEKLIHSQSDIYTNYSKEEISCDTILGIIFDETGGRLYWDKNINELMGKDNIVSLSSIYLTGEDALFCDGKSLQHGIIVLNNGQFSKDDKVFTIHEPIAIDRDHKYFHGWKNELFTTVLSNINCNSIIINDKYLCNKGYMNPDLENLLDIIMPRKLDHLFHLSIFSEISSNGDKIYQDIKNAIVNLRSQAFYKNTLLTLCYSTLHDRFIISNNYCITVGAGFALFNGGNKPQNSTSLKMLFPVAVGKKTEYNLWIKKTKEINETTQNFWGERVNRLFDMVN